MAQRLPSEEQIIAILRDEPMEILSSPAILKRFLRQKLQNFAVK